MFEVWQGVDVVEGHATLLLLSLKIKKKIKKKMTGLGKPQKEFFF